MGRRKQSTILSATLPNQMFTNLNKKFSYRRVTARCDGHRTLWVLQRDVWPHDEHGGGKYKIKAKTKWTKLWPSLRQWELMQNRDEAQRTVVQALRAEAMKREGLLFQMKTRGKVLSWEYRSPRKRNSRPPASVILCCPITYLLSQTYLRSRTVPEVCWHWKKIPGLRRFWAVTSTPG